MHKNTAFTCGDQAPHPVDPCRDCAVAHPIPPVVWRRRPVEANVRFWIARSRARIERAIIFGPVAFPFDDEHAFIAEHEAVAA